MPRYALLAPGLLLGLALAMVAPVVPARAIEGGQVGREPSPVRVQLRGGDHCSGVAVGRSTVLTSAHCLYADAGGRADVRSPYGLGDLTVKVGPAVRAVRTARPDPTYVLAPGAANDWAVLTLDAPLPDTVVPMPLVTGLGDTSTELEIYGFGATYPGGPSSGYQKMARCPRLVDGNARMVVGSCDTGDGDVHTGRPLRGDSGGPVAVRLPDGRLGLVERRGEALDVGLERLRLTLEDWADQPADELADAVLSELGGPDGAEDDAALLVLRTGPAR